MISVDPATFIEQHFSHETPSGLGVAVSGGSDSLALLFLVAEWAERRGVAVHVATVDHGLRAEAKEEAQHVAATCANLGVSHSVLTWQGWDRQGNLQAEARKARYRLLAEWAQALELSEVLIGHTEDDQAETFLIRLGRKSGVEGLAAMRSRFQRNGQWFGRPMLGASRELLRNELSARGVNWCEDSSNTDLVFDRVRARDVLKHLAPLGLTAGTLATVAGNLASARTALDHCTKQAARGCCSVDRGDVVFESEAFFDLPDEITHRLLGAALKWISGDDYAPRGDSIAKLRTTLSEGQTATLAGCLATASNGEIRLMREAAAVKDLVSETPVWDRWKVSGPWQDRMQICVLTEEDLNDLPDWRDTGLPRASLLASPALWYNGSLIAAPMAGFAQGFAANLLPNRAKLPVLDK